MFNMDSFAVTVFGYLDSNSPPRGQPLRCGHKR